ncbi:MAG: osmoprotectant transport system permease protein [Actinomycetota bacterium]|nr:osmoprotectant transport system permease protein [Actinomycetota bacterium]
MSFWEYVSNQHDRLLTLMVEHAQIVLMSVGIAVVIGVGLGVLTYRTERPRVAVLVVTGVFLTIPSFALFGLLISPLGLGTTPAVVALVMYALLPIVRNTITGLREVDPAIVESAQGMGMGRWRRLARIELPLAWPIIITGIRVSTQILVGIAAIAAVINGPGLGKDIFRALARVGTPTALNQALAAVLGIVVLGLLLDMAYLVIGRLTTSKGLRD